MRITLRFLILAMPFLNFVINATTADLIIISAAKNVYLQYEPIYLVLSASPEWLDHERIFGPLENSANSFHLVITNPDGQEIRYVPMFRTEPNFKYAQDPVAFSTIILFQHEAITQNAGVYSLQLWDDLNTRISNKLNLEVKQPISADDMAACMMIKKNARAYAAFVYLQGGDYNSEGLKIVEGLSNGNSSYSTFASAIMAMHYAQISYDYLNSKVRRNKDIDKSLFFFSKKAFDNADPSLKLKALSLLSLRFDYAHWPISAQQKAIGLKEISSLDFANTVYFKKLGQIQ